MTLSQRVDSYPSLPPSRADIFPAGLLVLNEITSHYGRKEIIHSYRNLRHGIASEWRWKSSFSFKPISQANSAQAAFLISFSRWSIDLGG